MTIASSIGICPIHVRAFDQINQQINNLEATLLLAKLKFHQTHSKIQKSGKTWIARSRDQMASWFGFSIKKIDRLLDHLVKCNILEKKVSLWFGKRRLFLSVTETITTVPVNLKLLNILIEACGSLSATLLFSRIVFAYANTKISHDNLRWCCLKKDELAKWTGLSIRTIDMLIHQLVSKRLLLKKKFSWNGRRQTHFHIPMTVIETLHHQFHQQDKANTVQTRVKPQPSVDKGVISEPPKSQNCRSQPAKKGFSIRIRTKTKETNNNTIPQSNQTIPDNAGEKGDIIFNTINKTLSRRQEGYLKSALSRTLARSKIRVSNPKELWEQVKFSVLNTQQHKHIQSFKHRVSRCMKILADGHWRTPIGFHNHCDAGQQLRIQQQQREAEWEKQKKAMKEPQNSHQQDDLPFENPLTTQAMRIAQRLVNHTQENATVTQDAQTFFTHAMALLDRLFAQGADRHSVVTFLRAQQA